MNLLEICYKYIKNNGDITKAFLNLYYNSKIPDDVTIYNIYIYIMQIK